MQERAQKLATLVCGVALAALPVTAFNLSPADRRNSPGVLATVPAGVRSLSPATLERPHLRDLPASLVERIPADVIIPEGCSQDLVESVLEAYAAEPPQFMGIRPGGYATYPTAQTHKLVAFGPEAIPVMMANLDHPKLHKTALKVLIDLRAGEVVPRLISRLREDDWEALGALASLTGCSEGGTYFRFGFMPETRREAVATYVEWCEDRSIEVSDVPTEFVELFVPKPLFRVVYRETPLDRLPPRMRAEREVRDTKDKPRTSSDRLREIGRYHSETAESQSRFVQDVERHLEGLPETVRDAVLKDWWSDLFCSQKIDDPDPGTDVNSPLNLRVLQNLRWKDVPLATLSEDLQRRFRDADMNERGSDGVPRQNLRNCAGNLP